MRSQTDNDEDLTPPARNTPFAQGTAWHPRRAFGSSLEAATQQIGRVLAGRYRIDDYLASGTMGRVYRATQLQVGRPVAVKILAAEGTLEVRFKKRFCREASIASQLAHPNIVSVYDYGETEQGDLFMVMELLPGRSLAELLASTGPLPLERALDIAMQVARGLRKAHGQGVVHRDLKPANIMVDTDDEGIDRVKVLDFGLVKMFAEDGDPGPYREALTRAGCMVGTPEYVSPEQALGDRIDGRADLYSLGVVMFQMITGRLPFSGSSILEVVNQHLTAPVPEFAAFTPRVHCPPAAEAVIRRAMAKRADERFESMSELLRALKQIWTELGQGVYGSDASLDLLDAGLRPLLVGEPPALLEPASHAAAGDVLATGDVVASVDPGPSLLADVPAPLGISDSQEAALPRTLPPPGLRGSGRRLLWWGAVCLGVAAAATGLGTCGLAARAPSSVAVPTEAPRAPLDRRDERRPVPVPAPASDVTPDAAPAHGDALDEDVPKLADSPPRARPRKKERTGYKDNPY